MKLCRTCNGVGYIPETVKCRGIGCHATFVESTKRGRPSMYCSTSCLSRTWWLLNKAKARRYNQRKREQRRAVTK